MSEKLKKYIDGLFLPYKQSHSVVEIKEELMNNLQEKLHDLKDQGYDEETAFSMTVNSIGDVSEMLEDLPEGNSGDLEEQKPMDFTKMDLRESDFKGVNLQRSEFSKSDMRGSDFTGANLSNSQFVACDLRNVIFDHAVLKGAKVSKTDLSKTSFKNSVLDETDLSYSNLSGVDFENHTFNGTNFYCAGLKGVNFKNAVFRNVSFKYAYYCHKATFDGATMDKVTFAVLKGNKADLTNVTVI
ncbi:pentapeptide repeat-containing protein [Gracilibacillus sp. D59]|uniref:pentapeptide repeat-containing protein n=1 Tax=Gracilibacillus sp. D59 TaxID=3457434 RepID=UPI003FCC78D5